MSNNWQWCQNGQIRKQTFTIKISPKLAIFSKSGALKHHKKPINAKILKLRMLDAVEVNAHYNGNGHHPADGIDNHQRGKRTVLREHENHPKDA